MNSLVTEFMYKDYQNMLKKNGSIFVDKKLTYSIIVWGPVGLATALLLAKDGIPSIVYESRSEIPNN